jgi:hypothetical protein
VVVPAAEGGRGGRVPPPVVQARRPFVSGRRVVWFAAAVSALAWLPFVTAPLSPDEGGFLLVGSQWRPGSSLYGSYWVDRPPLLISVFDVASDIGGAVSLRIIGIAAVVVSVVLSERLGRLATGRRSVLPALVSGAFLSTPLFGTGMVNGELLAVPVVLAGLVCLLRAWTTAGTPGLRWAATAGALAAAAPLIKQNVVDVVVVAGALVLGGLQQQPRRRRVLLLAVTMAAGAAVTTAACLTWAELRGTDPFSLWDAIVTFRAEADAVIRSSANDATPHRLVELLGAAAASGAPALVVVLLLRLRGRPVAYGPVDLRVPALLLLGWELAAVGAGGSYWLHYLIGVVPGLVLLTAAAEQRPRVLRRWTTAVLGFVWASTAVATVVAAVHVPLYSSDAAVAAYLRAHGTPSDTVVVGFGHPDIVWDSGLTSPYPYLWSLPVRVRDAHLQQLTRILSGGRAPTWMVVDGSSLATWGVEPASAQSVLERRYQDVATVGSYVVWRLEG